MRTTSATLNFLILMGVIFWNYIVNAQGINENSVGSLSAEYANLFTPSGYAFSIWGFIYLGLILNALYLLVVAFRGTGKIISQLGPWLMFANLGNAAWIWLWLTERTLGSVLVMLVILLCLLVLVFRLKIGTSTADKRTKTWVWLPISLYSGWITVATVANISAYLAKIDWQGGFSELTWTLIMLSIATILYLFVLIKRGMVVFTAVGIWAIVAIMVRHWGEVQPIQWLSMICAGILLIGIIQRLVVNKKVTTS